jgi:pimeloyl-ACP methyl ester carboxylesterase
MQPWACLAPYARSLRLPESGLDLFLYEAGPAEAAPLVLVHGLGDEADTWRHILPTLAKTRRVVALDLPGFGRSAKPQRSYTISFFQETLLELMDALAIPSAALVGHSLGAVIVQSTALRAPERVAHLALVDGGLVARTQKLDLATLAFIVPGLGEWLYNRLRKDPQAAYQSLEPYYNHLEDLPEAERAFLFQRVNERVWSDGQRKAFFSTLRNLARWLPAQQKSLPERLAHLEVPTLVVWGEQDQINKVENGRLLAAAQPSARLVIVPGAGHNVQQDNPQALLDALAALGGGPMRSPGPSGCR